MAFFCTVHLQFFYFSSRNNIHRRRENSMSEPTIEQHWANAIRDYVIYLRLERTLSEASIEAYTHDVSLLHRFALSTLRKRPTELEQADIEELIFEIGRDEFLGPRSQTRVISGIRSFFRYLLLEELIQRDPTELITAPQLPQHLPTVLSTEEVDAMEACIEMESKSGVRDLAIIETLFSCGMRVSELTELELANIYWDDQVVRVFGKGKKERFVPVGEKALHDIGNYLTARKEWKIQKGYEQTVFLNLAGTRFSRISVFKLVKELALRAGIYKPISPHTLRHSFATALVMGGADLRVVQAMLGHASIVTTEIYTHLSREHLRKTLEECHPRGKFL